MDYAITILRAELGRLMIDKHINEKMCATFEKENVELSKGMRNNIVNNKSNISDVLSVINLLNREIKF